MQPPIDTLQYWIDRLPLELGQLSEDECTARPLPGKWSKKEIVGHLCDSALTNLQRLVRVQYEPQPYTILKYDPDQWVRIMGYQAMPTSDILALWIRLNRQMVQVIGSFPAEALLYPCDAGGGKQVTAAYIIEDYAAHLEHHIHRILGLPSSYQA
ncbi:MULTISPECIES: DinB family protein [Paenibacillus]|uniref:DinB family protein n=1 Tax=Paenibacillus TaxID=44249 RepID=UPI0022B8E8DD|nr:DinB family protein [Paenibacillus caseinilyticus]MCZ8518527.1 DinB family protein [Paenibacillus caseinilyticus]